MGKIVSSCELTYFIVLGMRKKDVAERHLKLRNSGEFNFIIDVYILSTAFSRAAADSNIAGYKRISLKPN